jgi:hypothetical protein
MNHLVCGNVVSTVTYAYIYMGSKIKDTSAIGKVHYSKQKVMINVGNTALQSERMNKIHMQKFCV